MEIAVRSIPMMEIEIEIVAVVSRPKFLSLKFLKLMLQTVWSDHESCLHLRSLRIQPVPFVFSLSDNLCA